MNDINLKQFLINELHIDNCSEIIDKFSIYFNELVETNKITNLTAIRDEDEIIEKHFIDSLYSAKYINFIDKSLCDLGTGAGFPGIPLAIVFPSLKVTLVESNNKKIKFLQNVIEKLSLNNVVVLNQRAESLKNLKNSFDFVSARAMTRLNVLLELSIPLCKLHGFLLAYKLFDVENEINEAKHAFKELDCKLQNVYKYNLPLSNNPRSLLIIEKIAKTKNRYPRDFSKISSSPL